MRIKLALAVFLTGAISAGAWAQATPARQIAGGDEGLRLPTAMQKDPLAAFVILEDDLPGSIDSLVEMLSSLSPETEMEAVTAGLSVLDAQLGFSLKDELLAQVGPEFGLIIDLPPLDFAVASMSNPVAGVPMILGNIGLVAGVRDGDKVDRALHGLFALAEAEVTSEDGLVTVKLGIGEISGGQASEDSMSLNLYYGIRNGILAIGMTAEWVEAAVATRPEGERLMDGEDFRKVFKNLDAAPDSLTYFNLPKIRSMVEQSQFLAAMRQQNEELRDALEVVLRDELTSMGVGSTTVEIDGGSRRSIYGPQALSGGMMMTGMLAGVAIPNLLNAMDRGKEKRTMADIRSISIAMEAYAIDTNSYPGPTAGWEEVEAIAPALEPVYIRQLPRSDGWGHPILIWSDGAHYRVVSPGKDGVVDRDWTDGSMVGPQEDPNADIVMSEGIFIAWPNGLQQQD